MAGQGGRRRTVTIVLLVVVVVFGAGFAYVAANDEQQEVFCTLGLPFYQGADRTFTFEDGGEPGPGDCDGSKVARSGLVLGFDCKLRNPGGDVVAELEPNQPDGRCGLGIDGAPYPESWHAA